MINKTKIIQRAAVVAMLGFGTLFAADPVTNLTKELVDLRNEVEELHALLDEEKDALSSKMKSFSIQKSELEANIRREETRIKQLKQNLDKVKSESAKITEKSAKLKPVVLASIDAIRSYIESSMPFKRKERLEALGEVEARIQSDVVTPEKGANQLWALFEDELRLTRENGIYKETVQIDGENRLVEVARLGMMMMFYKANEDETGFVRKINGKWEYVKGTAEEGEYILALFDGIKKQIRTGYYTVPNALPVEGTRQ